MLNRYAMVRYARWPNTNAIDYSIDRWGRNKPKIWRHITPVSAVRMRKLLNKYFIETARSHVNFRKYEALSSVN